MNDGLGMIHNCPWQGECIKHQSSVQSGCSQKWMENHHFLWEITRISWRIGSAASLMIQLPSRQNLMSPLEGVKHFSGTAGFAQHSTIAISRKMLKSLPAYQNI
jgi:hypothetical protein